MKYLARIAVFCQANFPVIVSKLIRKFTSKQSVKKHPDTNAAEELAPLERTSGRRAADIAAGVPGAR